MLQLTSSDKSYIRDNYSFNTRQFNAIEKTYKKLSSEFSLDFLLQKFRNLAFDPNELLKFAQKVGGKQGTTSNKTKVKYIQKVESNEKQKKYEKIKSKQQTTDYKKESQKITNGLQMNGKIDFDGPTKIYYQLHPDGSIKNLAVQRIIQS